MMLDAQLSPATLPFYIYHTSNRHRGAELEYSREPGMVQQKEVLPFHFTSCCRLSINESLDVVEPGKVLLLLLHIHVVGGKDGKRLRDAALLQVPLHQNLEVLVQASERGSRVDLLRGMRSVSRLAMRQLGILVVEEVLNDNGAILSNCLNCEGALAGLLDNNIQT